MLDLQEALLVLARGGVLACPTETVLGLLADARNPSAVQRLARIKGRAAGAPIALILPGQADVEQVAEPLSERAAGLAERFWPGPLTLLASARAELSPELVKDGKVGLRVPGPSPAAELTCLFGGALTATSANFSGEPAVRSASELPASLLAELDLALPGLSPGGPPSTVVDATVDPPRVVRAGAIESEALLL